MPTTMDTIYEFLNSPNWTEDEKGVIHWQFNLLGDFKKALWEAICRADEDNLMKLGSAFPVEVEGFIKWNRGDLAERLRTAGLDI